MIKGFWSGLERPIFALAPMAGVTDTAFRQIIAKYGKPDIMVTEFVSCDGVCSPGRERLLLDLRYREIERPIVAQIFGCKPDAFYETARLVQDLGFDGIDINMGCPDRNVMKQGAGAALIRNPKLLKKIVATTKRGASDLPVSVKTRIGDTRNVVGEWTRHLLEAEPVAVTFHARTRAEMSKVPARWEAVAEAAQIARDAQSETLILGNGDIASLTEARRVAAGTGCDGVMIGRGIYGNPWLFNDDVERDQLPPAACLAVMVEHTRLYQHEFGGIKNFDVMKKHFKAYVAGFGEAKNLRIRLMETSNAEDVAAVVEQFLAEHPQAQQPVVA